MLQEVISLKDKYFKTRMEMEDINIPSNLGNREWTVKPIYEENWLSDYEMELL